MFNYTNVAQIRVCY